MERRQKEGRKEEGEVRRGRELVQGGGEEGGEEEGLYIQIFHSLLV